MMSKFIRVFIPAFVLIVGMLVVYAIAIALKVETVSAAFLLGFPAIAGFLILRFKPKGTLKGVVKNVGWLVGVFLSALVGSLVTGQEGLICVAVAVVPMLLGVLAGGFIYMLFLRWKDDTKGALKAVTIPVLALLLVGLPSKEPQIYTITNEIVISAPVDVVFGMLKSIPDIAPDEIQTRASHLLGVPKPTAAVWEETQDGAVRHSFWGDDVHFREMITAFEQNKRIAWDFAFPEGWVADGIEDPHVKVGGRYFNVISGEYILEDLGRSTRLVLTTRTYDNSGLGAYAEFWHHFFFEDFHEVILDLVKMRTEASI
jgi:hypothetical protein